MIDPAIVARRRALRLRGYTTLAEVGLDGDSARNEDDATAGQAIGWFQNGTLGPAGAVGGGTILPGA